jgi:succinate-acetate transporter protein
LLIGLPAFLVGGIALGLVLVGYVPATAAGAPIAIIATASSIGCLIAAVWAASLDQNPVASVFGIVSGFFLSYAALVLGLIHNWYGVPADAAVKTQGVFLISWIVVIAMLIIGALRLPSSFVLIFVLVDVALLLVLIGTLNATTWPTHAGGYVLFVADVVICYLYVGFLTAAAGGRALPAGRPIVGA